MQFSIISAFTVLVASSVQAMPQDQADLPAGDRPDAMMSNGNVVETSSPPTSATEASSIPASFSTSMLESAKSAMVDPAPTGNGTSDDRGRPPPPPDDGERPPSPPSGKPQGPPPLGSPFPPGLSSNSTGNSTLSESSGNSTLPETSVVNATIQSTVLATETQTEAQTVVLPSTITQSLPTGN